jgi:hypothetical protein
VDHCVEPWPNERAESVRPIRSRYYHDRNRQRPIRSPEFFSRIVRWRVGAKNYAIVFLTPILICLVAAGITVLVAGPRPSALTIEKLREVPERFLFIFLFIGLGEEPGWRGFALPELQKKHSPLIASLILAPVWAIWHLPLVGNEFPWPIVPAFLLSLFGATFMLTWLFNRTNGSVLLPMLFHHGQQRRRRSNFSAIHRPGADHCLVHLWRDMAVPRSCYTPLQLVESGLSPRAISMNSKCFLASLLRSRVKTIRYGENRSFVRNTSRDHRDDRLRKHGRHGSRAVRETNTDSAGCGQYHNIRDRHNSDGDKGGLFALHARRFYTEWRVIR